MKQLFELLPKELPKTNINSERADIIRIFVEKINETRPCKYKDTRGNVKVLKKLSPKAVAVRVGYLKKNSDLYYLDSVCRKSNNYVKLWFFLTKSKTVDN